MEYREYKLKEIMYNFKYGTMPKKEKIKSFEEGKYPIYTGYLISGYYDECNIENETLIVVARGVGGTGDVKLTTKKCFLTNLSIAMFNDEKIVSNKYLYYYFKIHNLRYLDSGSAQSQITINDLKNVKVPVPKRDIQDKIVKILSQLDIKIKLNNQINDNLHELAQVLFEEDLNKENLENYKLEDLFYQIAPGTNYQPKRVEDGIPFLNVKNINSGYIDFSDSKYISEEDYAKVHKTWQPEENDLLISRIGTLGLVAVIRKEDLPLAVHYNFLNLKTNKIPFEFGYFMLKSQYFQTKYKLNIKNSVQEYVTVDDIRKIEVDIPQLNDMEKYKVLYNKILNIQRENRFLTQLRDTLLPKLMNGEIDLDKIEI